MQKEKKLNLEILLSAIDRLQSGFAVYDSDRELLYANQTARSFWPVMYQNMENGIGRKEATRRQIAAQFPELPEDKLDQYTEYTYKSYFSGDPHELVTSDGRFVRVYHENLAEAGNVGVSVDITELKNREKELEKARQEAVAASEAKSRFLANMSHEIRTPLNGILGMAQVLAEKDIDTYQRECVETILDSGQTLLAVLNDVLDLSKIEAGKMEILPTRTDLRHCMNRLVKLWAGKASEKGLVLDLSISDSVPEFVSIDQVRLRQCISNLVSNAIKFTDQGHVSILVDTGTDQGNGHSLILTIRDTGIGIPEEMQDKLFSAFQQVDTSNTRRSGGTGLGLKISRDLAELMGGGLAFQSTLGEGTTFTLTVSYGLVEIGEVPEDQNRRLSPDLQKGNALTGLKLLLVDDNIVNRQVARAFLSEHDMQITEAENGQVALDILASNVEFDLILLDVHMPVMDGEETIRRIRQSSGKWQDIPVIALTADAMEGDRERYVSMGMDGYVSKPVDINKLTAEALNVLSLKDESPARQDKSALPDR